MLKTAGFLSVALFACAMFANGSNARAQQPPLASSLLDHLAGTWVMRYTQNGAHQIDDMTAQWVVVHHYLQIHEISRRKTAAGAPQYEALIHIGKNPQPAQYAIEWLDTFGGMNETSTGYAAVEANRMRFLFYDKSGKLDFINDMTYDAKSDSWTWNLQNVDHGKAKPFLVIGLTRS